jgi:hypothetical protein
MTDLTNASDALLTYLRRDAINDDNADWADVMLEDGELTAQQRGNLTDLKAKGLLEFGVRDSDGWREYSWYRVDMVTEIQIIGSNQEGA